MTKETSRLFQRERAEAELLDLVTALAAGQVIDRPVVLVVAHPDDEMIGMGSRLSRFTNLTLMHVTDGAPANLRRARVLGFDSVESYSYARFEELREALEIAGARPIRQLTAGFPDGDTVSQLPALVGHVSAAIKGAAAVITHAYEGGHPDHDSCALAVQSACVQIAATGSAAPQHLEFACYHSCRGELKANCFWSDPSYPEMIVRLSWSDRRRKRQAMSAFKTQSFILDYFPPARECYRLAPSYDFLMPPPPGEWYYDRFDWAIKGEGWLRQVRKWLLPSDQIGW